MSNTHLFVSLIECDTDHCEICDPIDTCTECTSGRYLMTDGAATTCPRKYATNKSP